MNICIIPARGGSKRIPRKNIRMFRGKPMIKWSIDEAKNAGCFDNIIVSTEDKEIADISRKAGADVPFLRPTELADDHTSTRKVMKHAVEWLKGQRISVEAICCLYATAPFVKSAELLSGCKMLSEINQESFIFAATTYPFPIQRAIRINSSGISEMINPEHFYTRSQDLEETYHDAGQFYWARAETWTKNSNIFEAGRPLVIPRWRVQDIDTQEDWIRAELIHEALAKTSFLK